MASVSLTGVERTFGTDEIIVSKTDTKGRIIYANEVFLRLAGFSEREIIGQPHSIIRHPAMPRCVFKLLWDTISSGKECFAYVLNRSKNGDHYWVLAHVTPTFDSKGTIVSYHSNRRNPRRDNLRPRNSRRRTRKSPKASSPEAQSIPAPGVSTGSTSRSNSIARSPRR